MTTMSDTFTQGGQTQLHKFRMLNQVFGTTLKISLLVGVCYFIFSLWYDDSLEKVGFLVTFYKAQLRDTLTSFPRGFWDSSWVLHADGKYYEISDHVIAHKVDYILSSVVIQALLIKKSIQSFLVMLVTSLLVSVFWVRMGNKRKEKNVLSGLTVVEPKDMAKTILKDGKASDIELMGVPLIKDSEMQHILMVGTTGAGKSNAFNHLLPQIRKRNQKAVIVDTTGDFVAKYYNPETDIILNPLDVRSKPWHMWVECENNIQVDDLAASMIPQSLSDPFWTDSSRTLFAETVRKLGSTGDHSIKKLLGFSTGYPLHDIQKFYAGTPAAALVDKGADKTAASIRMNLMTYLKSLYFLEETNTPFSVRQWVKDDEQRGFLFLVVNPEQRETLRSLLTTWINVAINGLMSCKPDFERRVWFIIDEKQSLNKIEALPKALAEIRKYGGCVVAGLQNISQIDQLYGNATGRSMVSLYNTKLFFRSPESNTAQWIAKTIGENEVSEHSEGISFGAHQMRDGVSLNEQKRIKAVVPYTDFMGLPNLVAYLKLSGNYPVTKLEFSYVSLPEIAESYVPKPNQGIMKDKNVQDNTDDAVGEVGINVSPLEEEIDEVVPENEGEEIDNLGNESEWGGEEEYDEMTSENNYDMIDPTDDGASNKKESEAKLNC